MGEKTLAVVAAKDNSTKASEAKDECTKALAEAKAAVKAGTKTVDDASKAVTNYLKDIHVAFDHYDKQVAVLAAFKAGPMAAFEELKDKESQPEPQVPAASAE